MSTTTTRKGRRRLWGTLVAFAGAFGLFLTLGAGSAFAAVSCTYNGATGTLTILVSDESPPAAANVDNHFGIVRNATGILVDPNLDDANPGAFCLDPILFAHATVLNTDTIVVMPAAGDNADGDDTFVKDERLGNFGPGFTPDAVGFGLNEIEIELNLGGGDNTLVVQNQESAGALSIGEAPADLAGVLYDGPTPVTPGDLLVNENSFPADDDADILFFRTGDSESIHVFGNNGDDDITGKGGNGTGAPTPFDVPLLLDGGPGDDRLEGGLGDDWLVTGPGIDTIDGNANNEPAVACEQNDAVGSYSASVVGGDTLDLSGETGPLTVTINNDNSVTITPTPQTVFAVGIEHVVGSGADDIITGNAQENFLQGGGGNDTISGGPGDDALLGGDGDDTLAGDAGNDCVLGQAGNDILNENTGVVAGTNGIDALDGGPGLDDVVDYGGRETRVVVNLGVISWFNDGADINADSISDECDDVFFTTENVITGLGNDILDADYSNNQADNEFTPGAGNDNIDAGAGNDILHEGPVAQGSDVFEGGSGQDTADYSQRSNPLNVSLDGAGNDGELGEGDNIDGFAANNGGPAGCGGTGDGEPTNPNVNGEVSNITLADVIRPSYYPAGAGEDEPFDDDEAEDNAFDTVEAVWGGSGNDWLTGNSLGNTLIGNAGNDVLSGEGGSDDLQGGDGNDRLAGGPGNDSLNGGEGTDWVNYQSAGSGGVGVQVNLNTGTATGEGTDTLTGLERIAGSSFDDTLRGDAGNNVINGRGGSDAIQGNGGDDVVNGGAGNDTVNGGAGNDTVRGQGGRDALRGNAGNDRVQGGPGNDTLLGGRGNDRLFGNAGRDFHNGGPGTDRCRPGAPGFARGDVAINCES